MRKQRVDLCRTLRTRNRIVFPRKFSVSRYRLLDIVDVADAYARVSRRLYIALHILQHFNLDIRRIAISVALSQPFSTELPAIAKILSASFMFYPSRRGEFNLSHVSNVNPGTERANSVAR